MKIQKGQIQIFLIGILVIATLIGGAYYLGRQTSKPQPQNIVTTSKSTPSPSLVDETANWKIYTNEQYGFEVKYPPKLTLTGTDGYILITDGSFKFEIHPTEFGKGFPTTPTKESEFLLEGIVGKRIDFLTEENKVFRSSIRFNGYSSKGWDPEWNYILLDASSGVEFSDESSMELAIAKEKDLTNFKILEQILSTFKLLK